MKTSYRDFRTQQPYPVQATPPYTAIGLKHEPIPPVTQPVTHQPHHGPYSTS